jgi:hypothetical protein
MEGIKLTNKEMKIIREAIPKISNIGMRDNDSQILYKLKKKLTSWKVNKSG